jgi:YidC/Oxa1 family membrane protein insertase
MNIFSILLYQPLFNALIVLCNYVPWHDFGIAIILLTIIIRIILFPISVKAIKSQRALQKIQPKIKELQIKYKDDKEKQAKELLNIYKEEKINPLVGLVLALIQLPILIALYWALKSGLDPKELVNLYSFVSHPNHINALFLGIIDLSKANFYLAIVAGFVQFLQAKMLIPKNKGGQNSEFADIMQKQMTYFMPIFTVIILLGLPSALGLYWTVGGLFSIIQQYLLFKIKD